MARLPDPGSDDGTWGAILNDFLSQTHKANGFLKDSIVTASNIASGTVTEAKLDSAVVNKLNATAPPATGALAGTGIVNTQDAGGTWALSKTQIDTAHAQGYKVLWFTLGGGAVPTNTNGLATGDVINGSINGSGGGGSPTPVTVAGGQAPTAQDLSGTTNDTVTLTKVTGVIWTLKGVDYPSSAMGGSTQVVPYTDGVNATVTAKADTGYTLSGTSSWTLTFTNVVGGDVIYFQSDFNTANKTYSSTDKIVYKNSGTVDMVVGDTYTGASIATNKFSMAASTAVSLGVSSVPDTSDFRFDFRVANPGDKYKRSGFAFFSNDWKLGAMICFRKDNEIDQNNFLCLKTTNNFDTNFADMPSSNITNVGYAGNDVIGVRYTKSTNTVTLYKNGTQVAQDVLNISSFDATKARLVQSAYAVAPFTVDDVKFYKQA